MPYMVIFKSELSSFGGKPKLLFCLEEVKEGERIDKK